MKKILGNARSLKLQHKIILLVTIVIFTLAGTVHLMFLIPFGFGGSYPIQKSLEDSSGAFSEVKNTVWWATLWVSLFAWGICFFLIRKMLMPLEKLVEASKTMADGNLSISLDESQKGEFGRLAFHFNFFIKNLRDTMQKVLNTTDQVTLATTEFSITAEKIEENSNLTDKKAQAVNSTSEQTNQNVHAVATSAEEMSQTIQNISRNLKKATQMTAEAVRSAEVSNSLVSKLDRSSAEIGNVVKVITSIAQQTNLLALNATIEAARAGEAGKGFAVVANEVKDLAKGTSKATEEIRQKIMAIQEDSQEAIHSVSEIGKIIQQIDGISQSIAEAVEQQSMTTSDINRNMAEAAKGTSEVVKSISGVRAASRETAEGAENLLTASLTLAQMEKDLSVLLKKFNF